MTTSTIIPSRDNTNGFLNTPMQTSVIAPFLTRLYQILSVEDSEIVAWNHHGDAFEIRNKAEMVDKILPKYFNNKNFASFQRQLNYFGFRKWSKFKAPVCTYSREHFKRGDIGALMLVKRQSKPLKHSDEEHSDYDEQPEQPRRLIQTMNIDHPNYNFTSHNYLLEGYSPTSVNGPFEPQPKRRRTESEQNYRAGTCIYPIPPRSISKSFSSIEVPAISKNRQFSRHHSIRLPSMYQLTDNLYRAPVYAPTIDLEHYPEPNSVLKQVVDEEEPEKERSLSLISPQSVPAFLKCLYEMIEGGYDDIIGWTKDGNAFEIRCANRLADTLLPKFFRHNKFASFQRQLNMYGFRKWAKARAKVRTYSNPYFQQGKEHNLWMIKRKTNPLMSTADK